MILKVYLLLYQCPYLNIKTLNQNIITLLQLQIQLKQHKRGLIGQLLVFSYNKVLAAYVGIFGDIFSKDSFIFTNIHRFFSFLNIFHRL